MTFGAKPYNAVVGAFERVGIDASTDEATPDELVQDKVEQWERLPEDRKGIVVQDLLERNRTRIDEFLAALHEVVSRRIEEITVLPLHGTALQASSVTEAVTLLDGYDEAASQTNFERYEIHIRFRNGDEITGKFNDKSRAIEFLETYRE